MGAFFVKATLVISFSPRVALVHDDVPVEIFVCDKLRLGRSLQHHKPMLNPTVSFSCGSERCHDCFCDGCGTRYNWKEEVGLLDGSLDEMLLLGLGQHGQTKC